MIALRPSFVILLIVLSTSAWAREPVTPQRPSFSSDPNTTARGTIELESGYAFDDADAADLPVMLKWGAGRRTEVFVGWSPWLRAAEDVDGTGDTLVGMRHRVLEDDRGSLAVQWAGKIPTADDGLGSGEPDVTLALASMTTLRTWTLVGYYQAGLLGRVGGDGVLVDHGLAVAAAHPLAGDLAGFVEVAGTWQVEEATTDVRTLAGLGYAWRPWFVWDVAGAMIAREGETTYRASIGFTVNLARVFD